MTERPQWRALQRHYRKIESRHLRELFANDRERGERLTAEAAGLYLDYSKNRINDETLRLLFRPGRSMRSARAYRSDVYWRENQCHRAARGTARRAACAAQRTHLVDGRDVVPDVHAVLDRMATFTDRVRNGDWKGHPGKRIRNVVNIGIGGSDLGPVMAYEALRHYSRRDMTFRFVSNVDGTDFTEAVRDLDPAKRCSSFARRRLRRWRH